MCAVENGDFHFRLHMAHFFQTYRMHNAIVRGLNVKDRHVNTAEIVEDPSAKPRVLMLTTFDLDEYVYEALAAGASGFLLKDASAEDLISGVRIVAAGDALLAPSITRRLIGDFARRRRHERLSPAATASLTPREIDVLRLIARGLSNSEIAGELCLAEQTVKTHVGHVLTKLSLRDRTQAVVYAYENGLAG